MAPIAVGEAKCYALEGTQSQDRLYYKYCALRYLKLELQGRHSFGHETFLTLTQSDTFNNSYVTPQFDKDDQLRRESTRQKLRQSVSENPYKQPLKEQIVFVGVALLYSFFGWYQVILGREKLGTGEMVVCFIISLGCTWGMYGSYYINVERNIVAYSKSLERIKNFRQTTTQATINKYDQDNFHASEFISSLSEDFDIMGENLNSWFQLYSFLGESTVDFVAFHQANTSTNFFMTVIMALWALYISFSYDQSKERLLIVLILIILLNLYTILRQLSIIVHINHTIHDDILKDLRYLRFLFRKKLYEGEDEGDNVHQLDNFIDHMEARPMLAGKLLGVTVKKSLLLKIALSFSAACASATLRAGLQDGGGE